MSDSSTPRNWFTTIPMAPSSVCSQMYVSDRLKKPLSMTGVAIKKWSRSEVGEVMEDGIDEVIAGISGETARF